MKRGEEEREDGGWVGWKRRRGKMVDGSGGRGGGGNGGEKEREDGGWVGWKRRMGAWY